MSLQLRSLPALLLAALLPLTGLAQSPAPEPLELAAAERILLDANPAILQARAAQAAARAGIDMAGARPNPQLTLGSTSTDPGRAGSRGFWNSWTDNTVRVDQLFERGNKRDLRLAAADLNLSASGADLANTIRLARIDLANAWLDLRVAREIRRIANENAALAQRAADAAELRGKAGDLAGVDVARFAADAARVANDALQAELAHARTGFDDPRLAELLWRYRARNFPTTLTPDEQQRWQQHCAARLLHGQGGALTAQALFDRIDQLMEQAEEREDERAHDILSALYDWAEAIAPEA